MSVTGVIAEDHETKGDRSRHHSVLIGVIPELCEAQFV
jgi:hypothetical protein